jgi:uncharacterized coiled-coil protein SlyX
MTIITDESQLPNMVDIEQPTMQEYSLGEQFNALFQDSDPIGSVALSGAIERARNRPEPIDGFDAFDGKYDIRAGYEGSYVDAQNPYDVNYINQKIDRELQNKEIASTAPVWMGLAVGVADPLNLLPFNVFRKAGVAAKSIGRTAGEVAVTGAGIASVREGFLQSTQETRTAEESAVNIIASGLIAGVLGGAGATIMGRSEFDIPKLQRETADYIRVSEGGSIGAAKIDDAELLDIEMSIRESLVAKGLSGEELEKAVVSGVAEERVALEGLADAFGLERRLSFQDPVMRMLASPVKEVREIVGRLAEVTSYQKKNMSGIASEVPVENWVKRWDTNVAEYSKQLNKLFIEHRGASGRGALLKTVAGDRLRGGAPEQKMRSIYQEDGVTVRERYGQRLTKEQFTQEVAFAARRNDEHEIPEVAQAAKELRRTVITPLAKEAQRVGLLPEELDVKTAESYLMRRYNHGAITKNPLEFDNRSKSWMMKKRDDALVRVAHQEVMLDKLKNMLREDRFNLRRTEGATKRFIPLAQKKLELAEKEMDALKKQVGHYETMLKNINERMGKFKPEEFEGDDKKYWDGFLRDLRRGKSKEKVVTGGETKSLLEFIASKGGIEDSGGDLKSMGADKWHTEKTFRGKLIKDNQADNQEPLLEDAFGNTGNAADDITLAVWEAGYFEGFTERPDINDLFALIDNELRGSPVYSMYREMDLGVQQYNEYLDYVNSLLPKSARDMDAIEVRDYLENLNREAEGLEPRKYVTATPATRARYRELEYHQKRIIDRLSRANDTYNANTAKYMKAAADLLEKREVKGVKIEEIKQMKTELKALTKDVEKLADDLSDDRYRAGFLDEDFDQVAIELRERILGSPFGRLDYSYKSGNKMRMSARNPMIGATGSLKARVWDIPDEQIEDFLVNDIESLSASYARKMSAQIGMQDKFGSISLETQIREINESFERMIYANPDKAVKLQKARDSALEDLQALRDRLLGVYQMDDYSTSLARNIRLMKQLNYMRLLGGMTVSAIPDLGRPVMVHGVNRVMRDGVMGFINNRAAFIAAAKEIKEAGTALDVTLNTTAMARADLDEPLEIGNKVEKFMSKRSNEFSALTLMNPWNAANKQFSGVISQSRIIQDIEKLLSGNISKRDKAWLAHNFIDASSGARILEQFKKHGEIDRGVYIPNAREWDVDTRELFRAAIRKTVDTTIQTPGIDKPLWFDKGVLRLVAQFRSFGFASVQRSMISGLQMRDMKTLNGTLLMVSLGMMTYAIKEELAGRELSDDPVKWIIEGVDRSGVTGWFMDANNITEKFTRGRIGVSALTSDPLMSRYASRGVMGAMLGPSVGLVEDAASFIGGVSSGEVDESIMKSGRRLLPLQNHFLFGQLFDEAGAGINNMLGIER